MYTAAKAPYCGVAKMKLAKTNVGGYCKTNLLLSEWIGCRGSVVLLE